MKKKIFGCAVVALLAASLLAPTCAASDPLALILKRDGYAVSLDLKFTKKNQGALQHALTTILDSGPNGFATGFMVGDGLVMTAYHVVSGELGPTKKVQLGFGERDELEVTAYVNGCQASVIKVDMEADLALLSVCRSGRKIGAPAFQASPSQDEHILIIARPNGDKMVRRGTFSGLYMFRGYQYWSAKIDGKDGYSGSPVYNAKAELVGVFSGYDWARKLALISPGARAQKLLEDYTSNPNP
jgi:S1-C subfamily serine protease